MLSVIGMIESENWMFAQTRVEEFNPGFRNCKKKRSAISMEDVALYFSFKYENKSKNEDKTVKEYYEEEEY